jgi:RNA polymerase sigma factor (TIGR02999 family)
VTQLLLAWSHGDHASLDRLLPAVYEELRRLAARHIRQQASGHTLQATALVHEAYLRLVDQQRVEWASRAHFFGVAAKAMRSILIDHARKQRAAKRGGKAGRATLGAAGEVANPGPAVDVLALDEALIRLAEHDPRKSQVVELRYFGGLALEEVAEVLGVSLATVKRDWIAARAWLKRELTDDRGD